MPYPEAGNLVKKLFGKKQSPGESKENAVESYVSLKNRQSVRKNNLVNMYTASCNSVRNILAPSRAVWWREGQFG